MTRYVVILQASLHGSPAHTTHDAIEAESCEEAEEKALAGWREAEPRYTLAPLHASELNPAPATMDL